jgi:hypothetical protein
MISKFLMPLLVVVFKHLNLGNVNNFLPLTTIVDDSLNGEL